MLDDLPWNPEDHDGARHRTPTDLAITTREPTRILIVGSCMTAGMADFFSFAVPSKPQADHILFNNVGALPSDPPRPIADYDLQVVQIPLRSIIPDKLWMRTEWQDTASVAALKQEAYARIDRFLTDAMQWNVRHGILTLVANFMVPAQSQMGRLLPRYNISNPAYFVEELNHELERKCHDFHNTYLLDVDAISATFGRKFIQDDLITISNHGAALSDIDRQFDGDRLHPSLPVSQTYTVRLVEFLQAMWAEISATWVTVNQLDAVKLVIFDLDDTIWRGVVADKSIADAMTTEGWPLGIAEAALFLKQRGIILAIVSKNTESVIEQIWPTVWVDRLLLDDFAVRKINWRSKVENIAEILKLVNLTPTSVVFIDDNPAERSAIEDAFPGIRTLGRDNYLTRRILLHAPQLQVAHITKESASRTYMMKKQVDREIERSTLSRDEFVTSLNLQITFETIDSTEHPSFRRSFELINKTNQFNTTGRRWTHAEMIDGFQSGLSLLSFSVSDKYTEYGLTGVIVTRENTIEQFVMSCRVFGLGAEDHAIRHAEAILIQRGYDITYARLCHTNLNQPCRSVFSKNGFVTDGDVWVKSY